MKRETGVLGILAILMFFGFGCAKSKSKSGGSCIKAGDCEPSLQCMKKVCIDVEKETKKANLRCRQSDHCSKNGACTSEEVKAVDGEDTCIADSDEDCKQSTRCKVMGACTAKNGACKVASNHDCSSSTGCRTDGKCTVVGGECAHGTDDDCRQSTLCKSLGRCGFFNSQCKAGSEADCKRSSACKTKQQCSYRPTTGICRGERIRDQLTSSMVTPRSAI